MYLLRQPGEIRNTYGANDIATITRVLYYLGIPIATLKFDGCNVDPVANGRMFPRAVPLSDNRMKGCDKMKNKFILYETDEP